MGILPYPSIWTLRVPKGSALTHVELDDNQIYLNKKINDTVGQNIGSGIGVYFSKFKNPDDGQLLFKSFIGVSGVSVTDSVSAITISSSGNYCDLADGIQVQKVRSCDCEKYQILGNCDCGTIGLRSDGVTFNPNSANSYRFPCYDGPTGYHLQTNGAGVLSWVAGGGTGATSGDSYISNVTLTSGDTICITRSDGYQWCVSLSAVTPYEYGEGFHSIQPRKDINYANATSSNIGGGSGNTVYETGLFSNIGGGQENDIYTKQSFIGGGRYNLIHALPTIATGSTSATTSWTGITYSGLTFSACTGGTWSATTYVTTAHTGTSFTEYAYSAVTFNSNHSSIVGGKYNKIYAAQAFIGGGEYNEIYSFERELFGATIPAQQAYLYKVYSAFTYTGITPAVSGGCSGETYTGITYSGITDTGFTDTILVYSGVTYKTSYSSIMGGERNTVHAYWASIGGGSGNTVTTASTKAIIVGGHGNRLQETQLANIVGGAFNLIESPTEGFTGTTYNNKLSSIVGGYKNQLFSTLTFIGGGSGNTITSASTDSLIVGGKNNLISGATCSATLGGSTNKNLGADYSLMGGGRDNVIHKDSDYTLIGGGRQNKIVGTTSDYASIVGGYLNVLTSSTYTNIVGGVQNIIHNTSFGSIVTGYLNKIYDADYSIIGGGDNNRIEDNGYNGGFIGGGQEHIITGSTHTGVVSGKNNRILGGSNYSIVGGGATNLIDGTTTFASIGSGELNHITAASNYSAIVNGYNNTISLGSQYGFIGAGSKNTVDTADWSIVVGGGNNSVLSNSDYSTVVGGSGNTISQSLYAIIGGGVLNRTLNASYSRIGGGDHNRITTTSTYSLIGGGQRNYIVETSQNSNVVGGDSNTLSASSYSSLVGGYENTIQTARNSVMGGGAGNKIINTLSNILGGGQNNLIAGAIGNGWNVLVGGRHNILGKDGDATTSYTFMGGGLYNKITGSSYSNLVAGYTNLITDSFYAHLGGGAYNQITASTYGIIVGGKYNNVFQSNHSGIVGGEQNLHDYSVLGHIGGGSGNTIVKGAYITQAENSTLVGGRDNIISGSTNSFLGGGNTNLISPLTKETNGSNVLVGGKQNRIVGNAGYSVLVGGLQNKITSLSSSFIGGGDYNQILISTRSTIVGGTSNRIYSTQSYNNIVGGTGNQIGHSTVSNDQAGSSIVGGSGNKIYWRPNEETFKTYNFIGGGSTNLLTGTTSSTILGGDFNKMYLLDRSVIGGGQRNYMTGATDSVIGGGANNELSGSTISFIGGGAYNKILGRGNAAPSSAAYTDSANTFTNSSILGGYSNTIYHNLTAGGAAIVNGRHNTILAGHDYSVIMGAKGITSDRAYTTFMNGLDVDTNAGDGTQKSFKYHGTFANQGVSRFLKDVTGAGDAQWAELPLVPTMVGDCPVVSAWTVGCILYMFTSGTTSGCTGTTVTANTCDNFTGPYRWKGGIDSISTTLPLAGDPFENIVTIGSRYSNIQGGLKNKVNNAHFAGILNGSGNTITDKAIYSAVVGTRDRSALNPETTYTRGIDANTDGVDGVNRSFKYHGSFANQGINRFLKSVTAAGDAQWADLPLIPSVIGDCPVVSAWTVGCILYMFTSGTTSGCTGTTITANTCDNIAGPYRWKGGDKSISTTLPLVADPFENIVTPGSRYSNIQGGLKNKINDTHFAGILNGSGNTIIAKAIYSAVIGTRDRLANAPETTYTRGIDANTDGVDGVNRHFRYHGTIANPGVGKVLTCINAAGDAVWDFGGGINLSGDCAVVSAYTVDCTLYMVTNCTGSTGLLVNGNIAYTANTCDFEQGPYVYKGGNGSISTRLPGVGVPGENYINPLSHYSNIDGGFDNQINVASVGMSGIFTGQKNIIGASTSANTEFIGWNIIGGGYHNRIHGLDSYAMFIGAGRYNLITGSTDSIIGAGYKNRIEEGVTSAGIFTGVYNKIRTKTSGINSNYSAIVNGSGNTINQSAASSAIIGSDARVATQSQTTYVRGLDALTNSKDGDRKFKYHGTWASTGLGKVLVDVDGLGNAQWQKNTNPGVTWTGDCAVTSAYTSGCTLYMVTDCTGTTGLIIGGFVVYTADTCNTFNSGPYRFGNGISSIEPVLNNNFADAFHSNITGGLNNRVVDGNWNSIGAGIDNRLTGYSVSVILQGHHNRVLGDSINLGYSTILNGYENINRHEYSTILNGRNIVTDRDYTTFGNGLDLNTNDGAGNQQSFKYYGTLANPGLGKVLTDVDGLGNAVWQDGGIIPQTSGCPITSAFTSDCILYLINCTGGTLTANTCTTFGATSPYEYGAGTDSIKPILGSLQTIPALASIGGGFNNHIPGGRNARIGGGTENVISGSTDGGILSGYKNVITQSQQSSIGGGRMNTIGTSTLSAQWSFIGGGYENDIKGSYGYNFIGGGSGNRLGTSAFAVGQGWSTIGGGSSNSIYGPYLTYSTIGGGINNMITGSSQSFLGGGGYNYIFDAGKASYATIVGGRNNKVDQSGNSFIGGGGYNIVRGSSVYSSIVGGSGNTIGPITQATYSNIQGGVNNKLGGDGPIEYGSIVNGKNNTVQHDYSVIMGSRGTTSNRPFTTFVTGLDANTVDADGGTQLFKYHGVPANPGLGKVLVDSTGLGHAVWADNITPGVGGWTGDCAVVSAFTQDCLLYMMTNCTGGTGSSWILVNGNITYTANTCNTFSESPYKYGAGMQTIIPKLPIGGLGNHTSTTSQWSNITGGIMNTLSAFTSTIGGGYLNKIESGSAHFIGSGFMNAIYLGDPNPAAQNSGGFSSIVGGSGNYISGNTGGSTLGWHFIGGGQSNTIMGVGIKFNSILGGNQNGIHTDNNYANVVGGFHNKIKRGSNYSSILTGDRNLIDYNSQWSSILAGSGNTIYGESGVNHGAIVNGRFNKVQHDSSAVIGADRRFTEQSHVTYTNGVDIDSDLDALIGGTRYLKYHGSLANPGITKVLTDVDGLGNAVWEKVPGVYNWTGDCGIVSAFTTNNGCTLNLVNCTGGTVTADTCNEVTGPYAYRGGSGSISTTLPLPLAANENLIGPFTTNSNIDGGLDNKIYSKGRNHAILGGFNNQIGTLATSAQSNTHHAIVGGNENKITGTDTHYSIIGGGYQNILYQSTGAGIFGGYKNEISESAFALIAGGYRNSISSFVNYSLIVGGQDNKITHTKSDWGSIVGGQNNILTSEGDSENYRTFIGGGYANFISGSSDSSIVGGSGNEINSGSRNIIGGGIDNTIGNVAFAGILNGSGNTINDGHTSSVILGGDGLSTDKSYTTFMNGLDVDTQAVNGTQRYLKYHGALANNGALGQVLTDVTGSGEATWQPIPTFPNIANLTGCSIVSAFTTNNGCDLNLIDCTGGTYTVDICSTFTQGPYEYGAGPNSIQPVLGSNFSNTTFSNIQGGINNKISNFGIQNVYSSILGGISNKITGSTLSVISSGQKNKVHIGIDSSKGYGGVYNGFQNKVVNQYSVIMGGANMTTNRDFTVFMKGLDVDTDATDPLGPTQDSPFKYHGTYANPGINRILTDIDGTGNARWMPCSTACSGSTGGATGTTKHVDIRNYTANVKETISHGLATEDVIVNVWTENKQKIDAEIFYVNTNQIEVAVSMDLNNVKTVIIG